MGRSVGKATAKSNLKTIIDGLAYFLKLADQPAADAATNKITTEVLSQATPQQQEALATALRSGLQDQMRATGSYGAGQRITSPQVPIPETPASRFIPPSKPGYFETRPDAIGEADFQRLMAERARAAQPPAAPVDPMQRLADLQNRIAELKAGGVGNTGVTPLQVDPILDPNQLRIPYQYQKGTVVGGRNVGGRMFSPTAEADPDLVRIDRGARPASADEQALLTAVARRAEAPTADLFRSAEEFNEAMAALRQTPAFQAPGVPFSYGRTVDINGKTNDVLNPYAFGMQKAYNNFESVRPGVRIADLSKLAGGGVLAAGGLATALNMMDGSDQVVTNEEPPLGRTSAVDQTVMADGPQPIAGFDTLTPEQMQEAVRMAQSDTPTSPSAPSAAPALTAEESAALAQEASNRIEAAANAGQTLDSEMLKAFTPMDPSRYSSAAEYYADQRRLAKSMAPGQFERVKAELTSRYDPASQQTEIDRMDQFAEANRAIAIRNAMRSNPDLFNQQSGQSVTGTTVNSEMGSSAAASAQGNANATAALNSAPPMSVATQGFSDLRAATNPIVQPTLERANQFLNQALGGIN